MSSPCCSPMRGLKAEGRAEVRTAATTDPIPATGPGSGPADGARPSGAGPELRRAEIPGGAFRMGTDDKRFPADREGPIRDVVVAPFAVTVAPITNRQFAAFADETGIATLAEESGWSFVFGGLLPDDVGPTQGVVGAEWWRAVEGADWRHPYGPHSDLDGLADHPVVHVTWFEAAAYARWAGGRLPTEAEWEKAARGGLDQARFPWGDELEPEGQHRCNVFQGTFPSTNTGADGWLATSPVGTYPANGYGLVDVAGNVWEWTADPWSPGHESRAMRGGSYLCHDSYCNRYRVGARSSNTPDTPTGNIGFRVAFDRSPVGTGA